jgi:anaerobic selenocysteine-containing dehydrogenase
MAIFHQLNTEEYCRRILPCRAGGMNWKRRIGLDNLAGKYRYARDPLTGFTTKNRIPERWVPTTCGYCSVGCGMEIGVRNNRAVSVRGLASHPVNAGKLCPKGLAEHRMLDAPTRAKYPLLRKNGKPERVNWNEALDTMVSRIQAIQRQHGADSFSILSTGQLVTEEFYALGKLAQLGFGTSNYDGNTTLCMSSAVSGYKQSFGSDGPPGAYEDLACADVILLIGANIADNHPILCRFLEQNRSKKLIVVDPRVSKTAMMADLHLPIRPRTDLALVNGIAHILIRDNLSEHSYVEQHTAGFEDLKQFLEFYTPEQTAAITGVRVDQIEHVARLYGRAQAAFIGWTMGVNHSTQGTNTVSAICNLALLTGQLGKVGAAPFSITGQCNAMGSRETSFTTSLPGYRKFDSEHDRAELAAIWSVDTDRIPKARGLAYPDLIEAILARRIKALWIIATNPLVSFPNQDVLREALARLDFLVVQDGFHPTPTTELAHLVLPAGIWGEKEGTFTNSERRVSKVNIAVRPPEEARTDFDIFLAVAERLGCRDEIYPGWQAPEDAFNEWRRVSAGRLCDYSGISYPFLAEHHSVQWPFPEGKRDLSPSRLYTDGKFQTSDGRARFVCARWEPFPEQPTADYPFVFNTGRTVEHWHTRTKTAEVAVLENLSPRAWLEMNPRDAKRLSLRSHDRVDVVSRRGRVAAVELRLTEIIAPGQVFMPFHFAETNANDVTQSAFDPVSRQPNYKQCAVRVERSGGTQ